MCYSESLVNNVSYFNSFLEYLCTVKECLVMKMMCQCFCVLQLFLVSVDARD